MKEELPTQVKLQVRTEDGDPDEIEKLTRQLLLELREEDVETVDLVHEDSLPPGAKSVEAVTLGAIIMAIMPKAVPRIIKLLQTWVERGTGRRVIIKGEIMGMNIEFEGGSKDFKELLESLERSSDK
jgi:hypothetical protein